MVLESAQIQDAAEGPVLEHAQMEAPIVSLALPHTEATVVSVLARDPLPTPNPSLQAPMPLLPLPLPLPYHHGDQWAISNATPPASSKDIALNQSQEASAIRSRHAHTAAFSPQRHQATHNVLPGALLPTNLVAQPQHPTLEPQLTKSVHTVLDAVDQTQLKTVTSVQSAMAPATKPAWLDATLCWWDKVLESSANGGSRNVS